MGLDLVSLGYGGAASRLLRRSEVARKAGDDVAAAAYKQRGRIMRWAGVTNDYFVHRWERRRVY